MTALADRLAEALEACQEDSKELLAEHSWWINEPRCGYAGRYLENKKRIAEAEKALAAYESHKKQNSFEEYLMPPCDCIEACGDCWVLHCDCQDKDWMVAAKNWCEQQNKKQTP